MIITLLVNSVTPGSYKSKTGNEIPTLDLVCFDKSEGHRVTHSLTVAVGREQKEALMGADLRDKTIRFDVHEFRQFNGGIQLRGEVLELAALTGGPLKIEKPGKAPALA